MSLFINRFVDTALIVLGGFLIVISALSSVMMFFITLDTPDVTLLKFTFPFMVAGFAFLYVLFVRKRYYFYRLRRRLDEIVGDEVFSRRSATGTLVEVERSYASYRIITDSDKASSLIAYITRRSVSLERERSESSPVFEEIDGHTVLVGSIEHTETRNMPDGMYDVVGYLKQLDKLLADPSR